MREVLYEEVGLTIAVILSDESVDIEIESGKEGPDLSVEGEVVVVADGSGCDVEVESRRKARAKIADEPRPMILMVRVHEFFEGWDLFDDVD